MDTTTDRFSITRRQGLAGLGALATLSALGGAAAPAAEAAVLSLAVGQQAVVRCSLTTSWLSPAQNRPYTDDPAVQVGARPDHWLSRMTLAQQSWLIGRLDTQARMGARVTVRAFSGSWAQVSFMDQNAPNSYGKQTSWVPSHHLVRDTTFMAAQSTHPTARVVSASTVLYGDAALTIPLNRIPFDTRLPLLAQDTVRVRVMRPGGSQGYIARKDAGVLPSTLPVPTAAAVVATAKRFLGVPYLWAGTSPFGFDCSGFTHTVLRFHGITVPRDSGPQMRHSGLPRVWWTPGLRAGDLLFWSTVPGGTTIRHVGMHVGDGQVIHAPTIGKTVMISTLSSLNAKGDYAGAVRPAYAA